MTTLVKITNIGEKQILVVPVSGDSINRETMIRLEPGQEIGMHVWYNRESGQSFSVFETPALEEDV